MSDLTSFPPAELMEIGLMAAADPHFADRLIDALHRLPEQPDAVTHRVATAPRAVVCSDSAACSEELGLTTRAG